MKPAAVALLACPTCGRALEVHERSLRCADGHSHDLSRQGYVNLLGGPEPGNADTAAMLRARGRVLASGLFDPVADLVGAATTGTRLLEVGAGTGFYLRRALGADPAATGIALDVSKAAAKVAAGADRRIAAIVADVWRRLPVRDHCLDAVLCVFAPRNLPEFARVLADTGVLVVVTPNAGHLAGLRERYGLLGVPTGKADQLQDAAAEHFRRLGSERLTRTAEVDAQRVADLIGMGPNAFHGLPDRVGAEAVTIDVTVQTFRPLPMAALPLPR